MHKEYQMSRNTQSYHLTGNRADQRNTARDISKGNYVSAIRYSVYKESDRKNIQRKVFVGKSMLQYLHANKMKVITMLTGAGKTHGAFNILLPQLIDDTKKDAVKLVIYVVPQQGLINQTEVRNIARNNPYYAMYNTVILDGIDEDDKELIRADHIQDELEKGKLVIVLMTDAMLSSRIDELIPVFEEQGRRLAFLRDEIHWGGHSTPAWAAQAVGVLNKNYKGQTVKVIDFLLDNVTPYVFGFTATPTPEHKEIGSKRFVIVNEWISPSEFVTCTKHFSNEIEWIPYRDFDAQMNALRYRITMMQVWKHETKKAITKKISELHSNNDKESISTLKNITYKQTMLIRAETKGEENTTFDNVRDELFKGGLPVEAKIVTANAKEGWSAYNSNGRPVAGAMHSTGWLDYANDPENEFVILIVINMGTMGVNIPSLRECFYLRSSDVTNDQGLIVKSVLQFLGRFSRLWLGGLTFEQIKLLDPETQLLIWNTFNVCYRTIVDTDANIEANEIFDADYAVLTDELDAHLVDVPQQSGSINPSDNADSLEDTIDTLLDSTSVVDSDHFGSKDRIKGEKELFLDELEEDNDLVEKKLKIKKVLENA
tara:strand:- start:7832 stop:9631 length:1800 start_codon:yes stop_codon:yes gene_type:complete